jgi:hypothetical protein
MALDQIYILKDEQKYNNETLLNIYTLEGETGLTCVNLVAAYLEDIMPKVRAMQGSQIVHTLVSAINLGNLGDTAESVVSLAGNITGGSILPIFNAIGFSLRPAGRGVRPGSKRIAGVLESMVTDGVITDADELLAQENYRLALEAGISDDDALFFNFIVLKRVLYDVPDSDPVRTAYRYPETDEELFFRQVGGVKTSTRITHQTSRGN